MATINEKDAVFLNRLVSLLNSNVRTKSKDAIDAEESCEILRWKVTQCFEDALKINFLSSDFNLSSFLVEHVNAPTDRMKEQVEKPWLKDKLTIGLMGHFSTGKTTALNLILEENLPTNKAENTALAAYLIHGNSGQMSIVTKSGQTLELTDEDSRILDYADGKKGFPFARIFDYIVKENRSPLLKDITFIDTPGLGKKLEHSEPSIAAMQLCDAVMWFVKTPDSVSENDLNFIKNNINGKTLYVVLSYVDMVRDAEDSISVIKKRFKQAGVNVEEYFLLGKSDNLKSDFTKMTRSCLSEASKKHDAYNPYAHIYSIICALENVIIDTKKTFVQKYNELDKATDDMQAAYQNARKKFLIEFNSCCNIMDNVADTFNNRCSDAVFCGGASGAICDLLSSYSRSFKRMSDADDAVDVNKLIEFGNALAHMSEADSMIKQASKILESIQEIKKIFE